MNRKSKTETANFSKNPQSGKDIPHRAEPLYRKVVDHIRTCIQQGVLNQRVIITESGLSRIFNISRTPARLALMQLEKENLIRYRKPRGFVVGRQTEGALRKLTPDMLHLSSGHYFPHPGKEWENIYDKIESEVIRQSIVSECKLNVVSLAKFYSCSRVTIHKILYKLESSGLVQQQYQSRWTIVLLDDKRLEAIFDVRSWLEPNLLAQAVPQIPTELLKEIIASHKSVLSRYPDATGAEMNRLELDMHERLLRCANNKVAMVALRSAKAGLISSKHILGSKEVPLDRNDPFIEEHISILEAISRQNRDESKLRLQAHLLKSRMKVKDRLRQFREVVRKNPTEFMPPWHT